MPRDYSSRRNNPPDRNGKRKTSGPAKRAATPVRSKPKASKPKSSKPQARKPKASKPFAAKTKTRVRGGNARAAGGGPGPVWFVCGVLIAVVIGSLYYIASRPTGHGPQSIRIDLPDEQKPGDAGSTSANTTTNPAGSSVDNTSAGQSKPRFSFYEMLPNYEVEVPNHPAARPSASGHREPHEAEPADNTPAASADRGEARQPSGAAPQSGAGYVIQAGAFSTRDDADHRRARLALLGVTAEIADIQTASGKTVYRVQSSVVDSAAKARTLAQRLQSHGIETMVRHAN